MIVLWGGMGEATTRFGKAQAPDLSKVIGANLAIIDPFSHLEEDLSGKQSV